MSRDGAAFRVLAEIPAALNRDAVGIQIKLPLPAFV
jgi:hypothetical protein